MVQNSGKKLADALGIHEHMIKRLEEASLEWNTESRQSLLHFAVIGGEYSGVETVGEILAALYGFVFLNISTRGSGAWSVDEAMEHAKM